MGEYEEYIVLLTIGLFSIMLIYFYLFYRLIIKQNSETRKYVIFYRAVVSITKEKPTYDEGFEQIVLNYNQLCQDFKNAEEISLLGMLGSLIHFYDTYNNSQFKRIFRSEKDSKVRKFLLFSYLKVEKEDPFSSAPAKESSLLKNIYDALTMNNQKLGETSLSQLSVEIINREKILKKKERENQIAIIISIIGIIFTIISTAISFIKF